jgi:antitoxin HigA-1
VIYLVIDDWMKQKNLSRYELSKKSGIPYTTLTDLIQKRTRLEKSSAETVYKLSKVMGISMDELFLLCIEEEAVNE